MAKAKKDDIVEEDVKKEELEAASEDEIDTSDAPQESDIDQEIDLETAARETETEDRLPPEVAAINTDNETAQEANKAVKKQLKKRSSKPAKPKQRSKKYQTVIADIDKNKKYSFADAIELVKKTSYSKFDGSISLDIRLGKLKSDESIRGTVKLPHGIDKKLRIAVSSEELIEKIKKGEIDFDVILSTPQEMPKLAQVAKILGPKGLMPNPKDGTVVEDPEKAKKEMAEMARYRADAFRNVHVMVGKVSWESKKIEANVQAVLKALARFKKETIVLSPTMGPGVKVEI